MRAPGAGGCRARGSRRDDGGVDTSAREAQAGRDVLVFEVGQLFENLLRRQASRQQVEHIGDADAQPPHARSSTALSRIDGDAADGSIDGLGGRFRSFRIKDLELVSAKPSVAKGWWT